MKTPYERTFANLKIGDKVRLTYGTPTGDGVLMDKYLTEDNVLLDVLMDNGEVVERKAIYIGSKQGIEVIRSTS